MQKLKTEIENMPMVDFVNQNTKLLDQAKKLSSLSVKEFEDSPDPDYVKGTFVFENYLQRRKNAPEVYFSEPIIVEGIYYKLRVHPSGDGEGTHIEVSIDRVKFECLNLDTNDKVFYVIKMLHSSSNRENDLIESECDWTGMNNSSY